MASNVATPLEKQFLQIPGLELITSSSTQGNTSFTLQFALSKSVDVAATDVQAAINQASGSLPLDLPSPPTFTKFNPNDQPIIYIALTSDSLANGPLYDYASTQVAQRISIVPGVSKVDIFGSKSAVRIKADPSKLAARGLTEAVTWSFISRREAELFGGGKPELALANPIAAELSDMRPSLLSALITSAQRNADRGTADVALFEVGQIFKGDKPEDQFTAASGVRRALAKADGIGRHWSGKPLPVDVFDAKADAFAVLAAAGAPIQALQVVPGGPVWFHPGRSGTIQIGPQNIIGYFGELHPRILTALKADGPLVGFEVILENIPAAKARPTRAKPLLELSPFQPVDRDFAFVVENKVKAADIVRAAQNVDKKLIVGVTVFDVYEGTGIEPGRKSVAIAVTMQPRDKTMTDQEIDALGQKIVAEVGKRTGGVLRG